MSKVNRRIRKKRSEVAAMQILEEAFHLIRTTEAGAFWRYYIGAVPWAVGLLYFIADMGRSSHAGRDAALAALILTGLYFWMRICQARFCAALWARLDPGGNPRLTRGERFRALGALALCQSLQVPLLVIGLFFAIPLGWILATQQNLAVLALTSRPARRPLRDLLGESIRLSHDQWAQNHGILIVFCFVSLFTLVNLVASCLLVPSLLKSFFGVETIFTLSPEAAVSNTTFLTGVVLLMQLAICPLMNAAYVLRCFYAKSRTTGADLLGRLEEARARRREEERREGLRSAPGVRTAMILLACGMGMTLASPASHAAVGQEGGPAAGMAPGGEDEAARLQREITETLEQKKYQWQLSRRALEGGTAAEETWLGQRLNEIAASVRRTLERFEKWIEDAMKRFFERNGGAPAGNAGDSKRFQGLSSTVSVALVILILGLLVWLAVSIYVRQRGLVKEVVDVEDGSSVIDLASEDIVATQLHEEEWLKLAREQIGKGEERLAIRALFLATLAHLGERGLLKIARFKSNRDYRGELALRARSLVELRGAFDENMALFERSWYGMHRLGEGALDFYLKNHGLIAAESARAATPSAAVAATR